MTPSQIKLYRAEWAKARKALMHHGRTSFEAEVERMAIHARVCGDPISSTALTNRQFTEVLMAFWVWSKASNLTAQLRAETEPARLAIFACTQIILLAQELLDHTTTTITRLPTSDTYFEGIFHRVNKADPDKPVDATYGTHDQWHKVMLACCYRYDQIARKALGDPESRKGTRYWPPMHYRTLALVIARHPHQQTTPELTPTENPF